MNRSLVICWIIAACSVQVGCVERRFVITTDPPGAIVHDERGLPIGAAPADRQFVYYGRYRFTLVHDGFQTQVIEEEAKAPWYEWFLLDFISENVIPWTIRDVRRFHYAMQPTQLVPPEAVLQNAQQLRERGLTTGIQLPNAPSPSSALMPPAP